MSALEPEETKPIVEQQPPPQQEDTISISKQQYQELLNSNLQALARTLNTLNDLDKIISSLNNVQGYVMNIKENVKKEQLGLNKEGQE